MRGGGAACSDCWITDRDFAGTGLTTGDLKRGNCCAHARGRRAALAGVYGDPHRRGKGGAQGAGVWFPESLVEICIRRDRYDQELTLLDFADAAEPSCWRLAAQQPYVFSSEIGEIAASVGLFWSSLHSRYRHTNGATTSI